MPDALRDVLLHYEPNFVEVRKYGMPGFQLNGKMFCYLWTDKKTADPYVLLMDGGTLQHPALERGDRKRAQIFRVNPTEDLPIETLHEVFDLLLRSEDA